MAGSPVKFGLVFKSFHWIMAVIILMLLSVGFRMAAIEPSPAKFQLYWWHKSFGILILMFAVGRIAWRLTAKRPPPTPTIKPWEEALAKIVHFCLYAMFILIPLSGWIMSSAGDFPAGFFGLFELPHIVPKNEQIMMTAGLAHKLFALGIIGLLAMHFAGAFKHHFIDRDETLKRMAWDSIGFGGGALLAIIAGVGLLAPSILFLKGAGETPAQQTVTEAAQQSPVIEAQHGATLWVMDKEASFIRFTATQYGAPFKGEFGGFDARIWFDPDNLVASHVDVTIPLSGLSTGAADRDQTASGADWFDAASFPTASFSTELFEKLSANRYVAHGTLTIRGVQKRLDLPFSLDIHNGETAEMRADMTLNRLDFGIGQGEWKTMDVIGADVLMSIYVKASPQ